MCRTAPRYGTSRIGSVKRAWRCSLTVPRSSSSRRVHCARGQIIDATVVPAPKRYNSRGEKALIEQGAMPSDWKPAKWRQKDIDATLTKRHGKGHFGYKLSINVDKKYKIIRRIETDTAISTTASTLAASLILRRRAGMSMPTGVTRPRRVKPGSKRRASGVRFRVGRSKEEKAHQATVRAPAAVQAAPSQSTCLSRACICRYRADGRQVATHHQTGAGELCNVDGGRLLQLQAVGLLP